MEKQSTNKNGIIEKLNTQLSAELHEEDGFEITTNVKWGRTSSNLVLDLVVRKNKFLLAVFRIEKTSEIAEREINEVTRYFDVLDRREEGLPIIITYCTDDKAYRLLFPKSIYEFLSKESQNLVFGSTNVIKDISSVIQFIKGAAEADEYRLKEQSSDVDIDDKKLRFFKSSEQVLDPEWCRDQLEPLSGTQICRYSSLDSLFSTLKYGTLRMNGLPGMNDKDEGLLAWNIIYGTDNTENEENKRRKGLINNAFIVSFSSEKKIDDLTQWRLYGDDARGVCCIYSVDINAVKDRFFLHPVKYIKKPNEKEEVSDELLQLFIKHVKQQSDLDYFDLSPAIFFYKLDVFKSEDEVRLLVDNKETAAYKSPKYRRDWLLTNSNRIPNPYIDVPLDSMPLKLEKILLGPNMNDIDTIQVQLETMLKQLSIKAIVEPSKIIGYRNPTK